MSFSTILEAVLEGGRLTLTDNEGRVNRAELEAELEFEAGEVGLSGAETEELVAWALELVDWYDWY